MIAALILLIAVASGQKAGASVSPDNPPALSKLVILGASYAGSWGTPPLPGYSVVSRGAGGEQTGGMRARFQRDVVAASPGAVLIWGHINNITQSDVVGATPERIEAVKKAARDDYVAMLKEARAAGIEVILATEIPLAEPVGLANEARALLGRLRGKQSYAEKVNAQVRDLNAFVRQLAAREGLRLLDFEKVFAPDGGARKPEYATEDRSHITAAGYAALTAYTVAELGRRP
jgi:lysophospholipase L1-like esterase